MAAALPQTGTFRFSNACASPGGDFSGYRVTITRRVTGMTVKAAFNDSGPDGRDMARNVMFDPDSGHLRFHFHGDLPHVFSGTVSTKALSGSIDGVKLTLPAVRSVPRYLPPCDPRNPP